MQSVTGTSRYALIAAALAFGLASPVLAETVSVTAITSPLSGDTTLTIPTIDLTDANLTEDQVRGFFLGGTTSAHIDTFLGASARSISIPEISVKPKDGAPGGDSSLQITGVTFADVANGIIGTFSVEGAVLDSTSGDISFGPFSLENVNLEQITYLLGRPGAEGRDPLDLDTLWSALSLGGATVSGDDGSCTIAGIDGGAVAVRMMQRGSMPKLFEQISKVQRAATTSDIILLQSYYYDALSSYAADAVAFSGIECNVKADTGEPVLLRAAEVAFGEAQPGTLPEITVKNVRIENSGEADAGWLDIQELRILSTDYASVAALFDEVGTNITDGSLMRDRQRELIPSVGGFEITGLTMDLPNDSSPGTRIVGGIDALSLSFDDYVNGIPTNIRTSATNVSFAPPDNEAGAMLGALGLNPFSLSYDVSTHWDRAAQEIIIDNLVLSADNAGTIIISGVLGNAKPQLFSLQPAVAMKAGQALTIKEVHLHAADAGLLPKAIAMIAGMQGVDPDQFRGALGPMVQGMVLFGLGGTPDAIKLAGALNTFLNTGGELSISAASLSPTGVGIAEFQAASSNPPSILKEFALTVGEAVVDEPVEAPAAADAVPPPPPNGGATEPDGAAAPAPKTAGESKDKGGQ